MSYLGDTLTVGLILILLFGSIALYLYTRIQQTEQKVSLLESIVLDLKLTGEIQGFSDLPHDSGSHLHSSSKNTSNGDSASLDVMDMVRVSTPSKKEETSYKSFDEEESSDSSVMLQPFESDDLESVGGLETSRGLESSRELESVEVLEPRLEEVSVSPLSEYDHMTMKEIQSLIRSRGLVAEKGAKKSALIETLKRADTSAELKPGSTSSSSFLDTSRSVQDDDE